MRLAPLRTVLPAALALVAMGAAESQKRAMTVVYRGNRERNESASDWVLVTSRPGFFDRPEIMAAAEAVRVVARLRMWTDDYSNLYRVLR